MYLPLLMVNLSLINVCHQTKFQSKYIHSRCIPPPRALFIKGLHNIVMHLKHDAFSPFLSLDGFDLVKKQVVYSTVIDFGVTET
jgi:hypothetical protein